MKIFNKEFKLKALIYWLLSFLPENIHSTIDILRRYSYWKKEKTIFIHIPKGAGVSVNQAIYGKPLGHFYAKDIKRIYPKIFKKFFTFSVVRNPIDRLYSAYHFSIQGGTNVMGIKNYGYYINNQDFNSFESFVTITKEEVFVEFLFPLCIKHSDQNLTSPIIAFLDISFSLKKDIKLFVLGKAEMI